MAVAVGNERLDQLPVARAQMGERGVDPTGERRVGLEREHDDLLEHAGIRVHLAGVEQNLAAALARLAQPEAAVRQRDQAGILGQVGLLERFIAGDQNRSQRI